MSSAVSPDRGHLSPYQGDTPPTDRGRLILTIQRQTETLDKLHESLREHKDRVSQLQRQVGDAEARALRNEPLRAENEKLRQEVAELRRMCTEYSRQQTSAASESAAQASKEVTLSTRLHALEQELHSHRAGAAEVEDQLRRALADKDTRISLLVEQLTHHGPPDVDVKLQCEQLSERHGQLLRQLQQQQDHARAEAATAEQMRQRAAELADDLKQRDEVIMALELENKAFKKNLSSMIGTLSAVGHAEPRTVLPLEASSPPPLHTAHLPLPVEDVNAESKLHQTYDSLFAAAAGDGGGWSASHQRSLSPQNGAAATHQQQLTAAELHAQRLRRLDAYQRRRSNRQKVG